MARAFRNAAFAALLLSSGSAAVASAAPEAAAVSLAPASAPSCTASLNEPLDLSCLQLDDPEARLVPLSLVGQNLNAHGRIRAFWGRIRPFEISRSFSGTTAFATTDTELASFWGRIRPFWGRIRPFWEGDATTAGLTSRWGRIRGFWGEGEFASLSGNMAALQTNLDFFYQDSRQFWDDLIRAQSGGTKNFDSFMAEFMGLMEKRHGIVIPERERLRAEMFAPLTPDERARFMGEWYDQLMQYSGVDQVDHWMKTARWSPTLAQQQGGGRDVKIGMLDTYAANDPGLAGKVTYVGKESSLYADGHGAAVASLMVAAHDGKGVMGVAPNAHVLAYNPFDASGTATWASAADGMVALAKSGASVINLSLGVPGYTLHPDWNNILRSDTYSAALKDSTILVFAAGNDGTTQAGNFEWDKFKAASFIVVGSGTADGTLSDFSNKPGDVCLTYGGRCFEKLSNRYIVAPGELLLVSDGNGGVVRYSGTSFAAPLVAGTVALLHDRWPWLKKYPVDTSDIILKSATPIAGSTAQQTGRGMLNITGAMSPLSWDTLTYYEYTPGTEPIKKTATMLKSGGVQQSTWEAKGMYLTAFEKLANTQRDFAIPLSTKLVDQTILMNGSPEQFQHYLYSRFVDWMRSGTTTGTKSRFAGGSLGMSASVPAGAGWSITTTLAPANPAMRFREGSAPHQVAVRFATRADRFAMNMGHGDGALMLAGRKGFGLFSDYDPHQGGVNPILGFASGGAYGSMEVKVAHNLTVAAGTSERQVDAAEFRGAIASREALAGLADYQAAAMHVSVDYEPARAVSLNASYTRLDEKDSLLGVQSRDRSDFAGGTTTDAATLGADLRLGHGIEVAASGTLGRTRAGDTSRQALAVSQEGLLGTALSLAVNKKGLLGSKDRLRLSVSQPLFVEKGYLDFTQIKVVDRTTGDIGPVTERFEISDTKRPWVAEMLYGASFLDGQGELSAFGRAEQRSQASGGEQEWLAGARIGLAF